MAYYSTHGISQFLLNNEKQRVRFLLAHPVYIYMQVTKNKRKKAEKIGNAYMCNTCIDQTVSGQESCSGGG